MHRAALNAYFFGGVFILTTVGGQTGKINGGKSQIPAFERTGKGVPHGLYTLQLCFKPFMISFKRLTKLFAERFAAAKKEKLIMDFNDYEHFCLKVLVAEGSTPEHILPTAAAEEMRGRYPSSVG